MDSLDISRADHVPEARSSGPGQAFFGPIENERTTASLAMFVAGVQFETLPAEVVRATQRMILDEIIVTAAAMHTPMARALIQLKTEQGGAPDATLMVGGQKLPAQSVAHVHAQLANLLDADETMLNRMHTVSASVMAGLAMAEKIGASGADLITAVAAGYDITARVGLSLSQFQPDGKGGLVFAPLFGWAWMALGAAMTAGRLLKLDRLRLQRALGQAFVTAPLTFDVLKHTRPIWTDGEPANWHKYQMCGVAAEAGLNAALLAASGWVAQTDVLDEGSEFWRSFGAVGCDWDVLYADLGTRWYIPDCAIKPYPFCRFGHAALDILTDIMTRNGLAADDIDDILVRIAPHQLCKQLMEWAVVDEGLKLMSSQPTAMALVVLGVPPGPRWFDADLTDPRLRDIARRIRHEVVEDWGAILVEQQNGDGFFRRLPTEVIVRTKSGCQHRGFAEYALGDPWSPTSAMSDERLAEKARVYLDGILPAGRIEALIDAAANLATAKTVGPLVRAMTAHAS